MGDDNPNSPSSSKGTRKTIVCPICDDAIKFSKFETHFYMELEKLDKITPSRIEISDLATTSNTIRDTFERVRSNRESRQQSRKRRHNQVNHDTDNSQPVSDETDESAENSSMSYSDEISSISLSPRSCEDITTIDVEDVAYGDSQYSERDLILTSDNAAQRALLKAITGVNPRTLKDMVVDNSAKDEGTEESEIAENNFESRLKNLEKREKDLEGREVAIEQMYKCLICMDKYKTPVTSVTCWHVYCEQCWLQTLGVKKLCPKCNSITTPYDLRKIFM